MHPFEGREVTPRESARMQCFPDWYWFSGTSRHPIRHIGNAVPSLLGAVIGQKILSKVFGEVPTTYASIVRELDQEHLFTSHELEALEVSFHVDQQNWLWPNNFHLSISLNKIEVVFIQECKWIVANNNKHLR